MRNAVLLMMPASALAWAQTLPLSPKRRATFHGQMSQPVEPFRIIGTNLNDPALRPPFGGGMLGDVEMQHTATLVSEHHKYKQYFRLQCGNGEEIDGDQLTDVVSEKRHPCLGRFFALLRHPA
jgi:hypothetical protein